MASVLHIVGAPSGNKAIEVIGPAGIVRPVDLGEWTDLRVGLRLNFSAWSGVTPESSRELAVGLSSDAEGERYWDATCKHFVGFSNQLGSTFGGGTANEMSRLLSPAPLGALGVLEGVSRAGAWSEYGGAGPLASAVAPVIAENAGRDAFSTWLFRFLRTAPGEVSVSLNAYDLWGFDDPPTTYRSTAQLLEYAAAATPTQGGTSYTSGPVAFTIDEGINGTLNAFTAYWANPEKGLAIDDLVIYSYA